MNFKKTEIKAKYLGLIDVGTYKVRVAICKILNRTVEFIWYWEKRQDLNDIYLQEIQNLKAVCENINQAIEKAEIDAKIKVDDFMINIATSNIYFESSKINYSREENKEKIDENEMYEILKKMEKKALTNHFRRIKNTSWFDKNDLKLIISNISGIYLDDKKINNLINQNWTHLTSSILNIFITENKFSLLKTISKYTEKNIEKIIPSEFALFWLFKDKKNIVIIDLWNSHTSIIVKKDNEFLWAKKLSFWINDLIKTIRENHKIPRIDIIQKIDEEVFLEEKQEFLEIFTDILTISLWDILKYEVCPNNFFMTWWWANKFIKKYLEELKHHKYDLKITKKINFVSPKLDFIQDKIKDNPKWVDELKSNINIYAMLNSSLNFIKKDKNKMERMFKKIIEELN